jgi:hypothetical protein
MKYILSVFSIIVTIVLLSPFASLCAVEEIRPDDRPNVLLIMVDDLRDFGGAFTKDVVKTPNLYRLRTRGTTF